MLFQGGEIIERVKTQVYTIKIVKGIIMVIFSQCIDCKKLYRQK